MLSPLSNSLVTTNPQSISLKEPRKNLLQSLFDDQNGTYPMHDLQAATSLLYPSFYYATRISASIGDVGQIIVNPNATESEKNVYVLEMPGKQQTGFYQRMFGLLISLSITTYCLLNRYAKISRVTGFNEP